MEGFMFNRLSLSLGVAVLFFASLVFAEELTITTYYPSPVGSYRQLSTIQMNIHGQATWPGKVGTEDLVLSFEPRNSDLASAEGDRGDMYYSVPKESFVYHNGNGWQALGGTIITWVGVQGISSAFTLCGAGSPGCPSGALRWNAATIQYGGVTKTPTLENICIFAGYKYATATAKYGTFEGIVTSDSAGTLCNNLPCWSPHGGNLTTDVQILCVK
jgi:hypothetical protein